MSTRNEGFYEDENIHVIRIECPTCHSKKRVKIPEQVVNRSKQLTTISISKGILCEHSFQVYLDKNFVVRGYEKIDFEFSEVDFFYKEQLSEDANQFNKIEPSMIEVLCPRCVKKFKIPYNPDLSKSEKVQEVYIDGKIPDHCGHEFIVYIDKNLKIIGCFLG